MRFSLFISKIQSFRAYRIPFPLDFSFSFSSSFRFFFFFFPFLRRLSRTISIPKHPFQIPRPFCNSLHPTVHPSFSSWEKYPAYDARAKSGEGRATVSVCISGQRNTSCISRRDLGKTWLQGASICHVGRYPTLSLLQIRMPLRLICAKMRRRGRKRRPRTKERKRKRKGNPEATIPERIVSLPPFFFEFSGRKDER